MREEKVAILKLAEPDSGCQHLFAGNDESTYLKFTGMTSLFCEPGKRPRLINYLAERELHPMCHANRIWQ